MHRTFVALALALSIGITSPSTLLDPLWARLSSLWHGTEEGCTMDPSGGCLPAPTDHVDEGCGMDPNGRCKPGS